MNTTLKRRLRHLEHHTAAGEPAESWFALAVVPDLCASKADVVALGLSQGLEGDVALYVTQGAVRSIPPVAISDMPDEALQAWAGAATTFPHVIAVFKDGSPISWRFETAAASRRYNALSPDDKAALLENADGFLWIRS